MITLVDAVFWTVVGVWIGVTAWAGVAIVKEVRGIRRSLASLVVSERRRRGSGGGNGL